MCRKGHNGIRDEGVADVPATMLPATNWKRMSALAQHKRLLQFLNSDQPMTSKLTNDQRPTQVKIFEQTVAKNKHFVVNSTLSNLSLNSTSFTFRVAHDATGYSLDLPPTASYAGWKFFSMIAINLAT